MIDLLQPEGKDALQRFITSNTLFAFDLDGTLAPIVANPTAVSLPDDVKQSMVRLSELAITAVITGRACYDARKRLGFTPHYLVGNHGVEGLPGVDVSPAQLRQLVDGWEQQVDHLLTPALRAAISIESKGASLSLHYRHAVDPAATLSALQLLVQQLTPLPRQVGGKCVINLVPPGAPHKGDALLQLMHHAECPRAVFIGDDETDEDVFRLNTPTVFSVCIGTERPTAARYFLTDQADIALLLKQLIAYLQQTHSAHDMVSTQ